MSEVTKLETEAGTLAREIVAKRVAITGALGVALDWALAAGYVSVGLDGQITKIVGVALNVLAIAVGVLWSRDAVTPADPTLSPVSSNGKALIEAPARPVAASIASAAAAKLADPTPVAVAPADDSASA